MSIIKSLSALSQGLNLADPLSGALISKHMAQWIWRTLVLIAFVIICADNHDRGWDFDIFYKAASTLLDGQSPYLFHLDSGCTFKYPPWSLWLFVPFTFFSLSVAKFIWGLFQCASLVFIYQYVRKNGVRFGIAVAAITPFWFTIHYHALSGQVNLLLLALLVGAQENWVSRSDFKGRYLFFGVVWALSLKVFSLVAMAGFLLSSKFKTLPMRSKFEKWAWITLGFVILTLPICLITHTSPLDLFFEWQKAASILSSPDVTWAPNRAWNNAGLPGALLRLFQVDYKKLSVDIGTFAVLSLLSGWLWYKHTQKHSWNLKWSGWIALATFLHPLVWMMTYVQVIPLSCFGLQHVLNTKAKWRLTVFILGLFFTTMITSNTFKFVGITALDGLAESISIKALGTILMCLAVAGKREV